MENNNSDTHKKFKTVFLIGCLLPTLLLLLVAMILILMQSYEKPAKPEYIVKVEKKIVNREKKLETEKKQAYDIDQTIQALYSIQKALNEAKSFKDLSGFILQEDSSLVASDAAALKYRFFNIYKDLLQSEDSLEELQSLYGVVGGSMLDLASTVSLTGTGLSVNREQAEKVWNEHISRASLERKMRDRLYSNQERLLKFYFDYMKIRGKYLREWNKLCALRDRTYISIFENKPEEAIKNASAAVALAPNEKEAHLLLTMCLLERAKETDLSQAESMITDYLKKHHGQEAPAYLLRGVIRYKQKQYDTAVIDFDQAATYYPKQQKVLLDKLNLYKKRSFLNKSKEGRMIINMYRSMMTGSGYFSPDFQLARVHLDRGDKEHARSKIFDHFFRRRNQGQWDRVLNDFRFCSQYLDSKTFAAIPGNKLKLQIEPAFLFNKVIVKIKNDSKQAIHNVSVLLCVRFTDMFKGDYVAFPVGETVATLQAGESIEFGRRHIAEVTKEKLGAEKAFKDIIQCAAVLISDETITWIVMDKVVPPTQKAADEKSDRGKVISEKLEKKMNKAIDKAIDKADKLMDKAIDKAVDAVSDSIEKKLDGDKKSDTAKQPDKK